MDKTAWVSRDIQRGAEILNTLEESKLKIGVALWAFLPEYEDWRLIVSSRQLDSLHLMDAYDSVIRTLAAAGFTAEKTPPIVILPMADSSIKELRRLFRRAKDVEGMRLGGQMIGSRFIEDAYVYRIS